MRLKLSELDRICSDIKKETSIDYVEGVYNNGVKDLFDRIIPEKKGRVL